MDSPAHAEQARAVRLHALRLTVAQVLAADYVLSNGEPPDWGKAMRLLARMPAGRRGRDGTSGPGGCCRWLSWCRVSDGTPRIWVPAPWS
jgi:hypothetical protein